MTDVVDKAIAWDALAQARANERKVILDILVKAALVRDCFHMNGSTMKNAAGHDLFIDATKIDDAIATIRARDTAVGGAKS